MWRRGAGVGSERWNQLFGPATTLLVILGLEFLAGVGWDVPNPPALLILSVVFSAFRGGLGAGLVSAAMAWTYTAFFFADASFPLHYSVANFRRVGIWALAMPAIAAMVGVLKRRTERAAEELASHRILESQVAERRMVEQALAFSEIRFRTLAESAPIGIFETDAFGETTFVNQRWCEIAGMSAERALGRGWLDAVHPEDRPRLDAHWHGAVAPARDTRSSYRFLKANGEVVWVAGQATEIFDAAGNLTGYVGVVNNVTAAKVAERSAELRRRLLAVTSAAGRTFLGGGDWRRAIQDLVDRLGEASEISRISLWETASGRRDSGDAPLFFEWRAAAISAVEPLPNARKSSPDARVLAAWEELLRRGLTVERDLAMATPEERALLSSRGCRSLIALPIIVREQLWGAMCLEECMRERLWSMSEVDALSAAVGTVAAAVERRQVDEALNLSARRFRELFENAPVAVWEMDFSHAKTFLHESAFFEDDDPRRFLAERPELAEEAWRRVRIVDVNRPGLQLLGVSSRKELFANLERFAAPQLLKDSVVELLALHRGETQVRFETRCLNLQGDPLDVVVNWQIQPGRERDARSVLISVVDITDQKRIERELRELERQLEGGRRMETVGRLAGGIAHDFNNLLTVVLGSVEFLQERVRAEDPAREDIERIRAAGERAANLTRQLLAFSRRQVLKPTTFDLNDLVRDTQQLLLRLLPENIACRIELTAEPAFVLADATQYEQVLMNLVLNARDAMPNGGVVTIETLAVDESDGDHWAGYVPRPPRARYVVLRVRDTGSGFTGDALERCFEPFFTTKKPGQGTGLGLSTAYGIVKQSGGFLWASNRPEGGAQLEVVLASVPSIDAPPLEVVPPPPPTRSATILLVEDATDVRAMVRLLLEQLGYRVLEADSPRRALEIAGGDQPIDLLLTDVVMPEMNGDQLRREIARLRPGLRALLMSGYTDDVLRETDPNAEPVALIHKPFTLATLAAAVAAALE